MPWHVEFEDAFEAEFLVFEQEVQDGLLAVARLLVDYGPQVGRMPTRSTARSTPI